MFLSNTRRLSSFNLKFPFINNFRLALTRYPKAILLKGRERLSGLFQFTDRESLLSAEPSQRYLKNTFDLSEPLKDLRNLYMTTYKIDSLKTKAGYQFVNQGKFLSRCEQLGMSNKDARTVSRFMKFLNLDLPSSCSLSDLNTFHENVQRFIKENTYLYKNNLRFELHELERTIKPLKRTYVSIKTKAVNSVEKSLKFSIGFCGVQSLGLYYGAHLYGLSFTEPFTFALASGGFMLCGVLFDITEQGVRVKKMMYERKLKSIINEEKINTERIAKLQQEIDCVRNELIELN